MVGGLLMRDGRWAPARPTSSCTDDHLVTHVDEPPIVGEHVLDARRRLRRHPPRRRRGTPAAPPPASPASSSGAAARPGTIETTVALKNTPAESCILGGYPGMLLLNVAGGALPTNVVRKGNYSFTAMAPTTVTLAPGSRLLQHRLLGRPGGQETSCPTSAALEVTPPNAVRPPVGDGHAGPVRGGTLVVSPVFSATGPGTARRRAPTRSGSMAGHGADRARTSTRPLAPPARMSSKAGPELVETELALDHVLEQVGRVGGGHLPPDPAPLGDRGLTRYRCRSGRRCAR